MARKGDGIYLKGATWRLDCRIKGVRHQVALGKKISRTVASELAVSARGRILRGEQGIGCKKEDLSFDEAKRLFLAWSDTNKRPKTQKVYRSVMNTLSVFFGGKTLSSISPFLIESYKQKRLATGKKVAFNRELSELRVMFNLLIKWKKFTGPNPAARFPRAPESRGRVRFRSDSEERALLAEAREPVRSLIVVAIHTGLRAHSEGLSLTWGNINFEQKSVTIEDCFSKNGETRTVPLNSVALQTLRDLRERALHAGHGLPNVFASQRGSPKFNNLRYEPLKSFRTSFETACRRAKLSADVTPHVLRHTFASRLVMRGADLRTVQELGGWKSLTMVQRYSHLSAAHKQQAIELLADNSPAGFTTAPQRAEGAEPITANVINMMGR